MCWCTPNLRTPDCGKATCWPHQSKEKPRIRPWGSGFWLCEGGNLGGIGTTPARAYRAWVRNMANNGSTRMLRRFGMPSTPPDGQ